MAVLWNTADKTANVTLSGGSLTATLTSAAYGGVRADTSASGKIYFEIAVNTVPSVNIGIGWANATASLSTYTGQDNNSWNWFFYTGTGNVWINNGPILGTGEAAVQTEVLGIAFDTTAKLGWVRVKNSRWNGSATADPATGTGGFSVSGLNAGPYFPCFNSNVNGASITANFGASSFTYAIPSGFSGLDTNVQNYEAAAKIIAYAELPPPLNAVDAAKIAGYANLPPPRNAVDVGKFIAYAQVPPPRNAVDCGKMVAYAILQPTPATLSVGITEAPDVVAASVVVSDNLIVWVSEAPDAVYAQLGHNVVINIASEEADGISMVLNNPGSWAACTDKNTAWTECAPAAPTVWTECTPKAPTFWCPEPRKNRRRKKKWS
jgi:hypothetical protein